MRLAAWSLVTLLLSVPALAQGQINIYNWTDYTVGAQLKDFEKQTGIKVNNSTYDTNEILDAKLRVGGWNYDVVVPTASPFFVGQLKAKLYQKLDRTRLKNWGNLDPDFLAALAPYDPGNQYAVPFMWGSVGIGYDAEEVWKRMPGAPVDSLSMIFDPAVVSKFKDCGVMVIDSATEVLPAALRYLGLNPDSKKREDLAKAGAAMRAIRPYLRKFDSQDYIKDLGDGRICLAFGFSGGIFQARERAARALPPREISYGLPKEGAQLWIDVLAIPKDALNVENAYRFIDFMLDAKVAAAATEFTGYANANRAAAALPAREVSSSPIVYPPAEARARFYSIGASTQEQIRDRVRLWAGIARGR